jgi:hypothetical protein
MTLTIQRRIFRRRSKQESVCKLVLLDHADEYMSGALEDLLRRHIASVALNSGA